VLRFLFGKRSALTRHDFQLLELLYWSHERHQWLVQSNRRVISATDDVVMRRDTFVSAFPNVADCFPMLSFTPDDFVP
jgi:hypothetical protein